MSIFKNLFAKPQSIQLHITSNNGFHLRPVAQFVALAKTFPCQVTASYQDRTVDAKAVNSLLSLSLEKGDSFTLNTKGKKAEEALTQLHTLFETLMHNDKEVKPREKEVYSYEGDSIGGEIISEGIAIAPVYRYSSEEILHKNNLTFQEAIDKSLNELDALYTTHQANDNAGIYLAQKELLDSLNHKGQTLSGFEQQIEEESQRLLGSKLDAKRSDYQDLLQRVKKHLGIEKRVTFPDTPFILLAEDLLPSEIDTLTETNVLGVVLKHTSIHSHTAILLRGAGISSLIADISLVDEKHPVILDTHAAVIVLTPTQSDLEKAERRLEKEHERKNIAAEKRFDPAETKKGKSIKVFANVTDTMSARTARDEGAEGIGLLRTEFLFKEEKPSFEMQVDAYKKIFAYFDDITVRTLDVGGDKALPYIDLPNENNPFLGIRGIRLLNTYPELMEDQLHAIFTAADNRPVKIMFPMVSSVEEFTKAKYFSLEIAKKYQIDISNILFGIMIEVPSVLFLIDSFNEVVDFYSIGTNDLTQYLFAIERTHPTLKTDELSSVVFDAIAMIMDRAAKPVSICGELAANKQAVPRLLEIGIEVLSVSAKSIAKTKEEIRHV
jgi:phosphocarrier protein FPr